MHFVNEAGSYQPGQLAAAEKAKLPPDAIQVVQQLLLWFPHETRLYWLLAELYAARGDLRAAATFFEMCSWGRQYANRKIMMNHREAVLTAMPKEAPPSETPLATGDGANPQPPGPEDSSSISMHFIWWYFAAIGIVVLVAIARGKYRRCRGIV